MRKGGSAACFMAGLAHSAGWHLCILNLWGALSPSAAASPLQHFNMGFQGSEGQCKHPLYLLMAFGCLCVVHCIDGKNGKFPTFDQQRKGGQRKKCGRAVNGLVLGNADMNYHQPWSRGVGLSGECAGIIHPPPALGTLSTIPQAQLNKWAIKSKNDSNSAVNIMWLQVK